MDTANTKHTMVDPNNPAHPCTPHPPPTNAPELPQKLVRNSCCCNWSNCQELQQQIHSSSDDRVEPWKGALIKIHSSKSSKAKALVNNIHHHFKITGEQSEYYLARHHWGLELWNYQISMNQHWTTPLS
jgi:hypothetical protein